MRALVRRAVLVAAGGVAVAHGVLWCAYAYVSRVPTEEGWPLVVAGAFLIGLGLVACARALRIAP
jgi:uncharacterized membrane protein HdeD (DUF308 family)